MSSTFYFPEAMPPVTICAAFQAVRRLEAFTISNPWHRLGELVELMSFNIINGKDNKVFLISSKKLFYILMPTIMLSSVCG